MLKKHLLPLLLIRSLGLVATIALEAKFDAFATGSVYSPSTLAPPETHHEQKYLSGKEWFQEIAVAYEKGEHTSFLSEMHMKYQKGIEEGDWADLMHMEKNLEDAWKTADGKKEIELMDRQAEELLALRHAADQKLCQIAQAHSQLFISKMIIHASLPLPFSEEEQKIYQEISDLEFPSPKEYSDPLFQKLKEIARSFHYQKTLAYRSFPAHVEKFQKHLVVLDLEKLHKMQQLCKAEKREDISEQIEITRAVYSAVIAKKHEFFNLQSTLKKIPPASHDEATKQVSNILKSLKDNQRELHALHTKQLEELWLSP